MKLSFTTLGCPAWSLEEIAANGKSMGFDAAELRGVAGEHIGPDETPTERERIRKLFADTGIGISCIMGYSHFTCDDLAQRKENIDIALRFIDLAADIGCPALRVFGGAISDAGKDESLMRVIEGLRTVSQAAEQKGIAVALETHDAWTSGKDVAAVLDGVDSPALGACWDVANSFFVEPLADTFAAIKDRIMHVHFKDAKRKADGTIGSTLPGEGEVDLRAALSLLHESGYDRALSFEWEKKWEPELQEPEVAFPHWVAYTTKLMRELGVPRSH